MSLHLLRACMLRACGSAAAPRLATVALSLIALLAASAAQAQSSPTMAFSQIDMFLDDGSHIDSDWGSVDMTFSGSSSLMYLNVSVNSSWQIQNIPVLSIEGPSAPQTMTYNFNLGVSNGVDYLGPLSYGYSLTPGPILIAPLSLQTQSSVPTRIVNEYTGEVGGTNMIEYAPAGALIGAAIGGALGLAKAQPAFPNQEAGVNECAPVAVSNSLQYLNAQHGLGMAAADITIAKMKIATGWDDGCPIGWWNVKDQYMQDNNLPITTMATTNIATAMAELDDKCDVELGSPNHRAAVVGITDLGGGKYSIDVAHDTDQGNAGGTKVETVTYDSNTGKLTGATFFNNVDFRNFVIECPDLTAIPEPSGIALVAIGLAAAAIGNRRRGHA